MRVLGLDIGGANLKAATAEGTAASESFPLWRDPHNLSAALEKLHTRGFDGTPDLIGLTMTGELADCFPDRATGVAHIIAAAKAAFPSSAIRVWLTSGEFADPPDAVEVPILAAASNWHALATWAALSVPDSPGLLLDVGSTTADVIALRNGLPEPVGLTDRDRLISGELIYTGIRRSPVATILSAVTLEETRIPLAAEAFAYSGDAWLLAAVLEESEEDVDTANGRPFTRSESRIRLARMICSDASELCEEHWRQFAGQVMEAQAERVASSVKNALTRMDCAPESILISGSGTPLAELALAQIDLPDETSLMKLGQLMSSDVSSSACAFAVARLVHDRCRTEALLPDSTFPVV